MQYLIITLRIAVTIYSERGMASQPGVLKHGEVVADQGLTDLFIRPGFTFGAVEGLITNFHLPRSTLLMLVAAFAGQDLVKRCYQAAIKERYRFYSYGDCMLIL